MKSFDGLNLYTQTWKTPGKPKAVINLVHGLGEHSSRYSTWVERFTKNGYAVRSFDMRGHGLSDGKRGYSPSYKSLITDIDDFLRSGREEFPFLPMILYGHSLGGNLALNYISSRISDLKGLIITSPWLELVKKPGPATLLALSVLGRIIPGLQVSNGVNSADLSRDKQVVLDYKTDPLVHDRITLRLGFQIFDSESKTASCIHKINVPMLIMHGSADKITSCPATRNFVRYAGNRTTYIEWEGASHELHNDIIRNNVFTVTSDWLDSIVQPLTNKYVRINDLCGNT